LLCLCVSIPKAWSDDSSGLISANGRILDSRSEPVLETTKDKKNEETKRFFLSHLNRLILIGDDKILIGSDGRFGMDTQFGWTNDFVISVGKQFASAPDNHGSTMYTLKEILEDKIRITYRAEFHHGSFGINKISVDEGTIEIAYKE